MTRCETRAEVDHLEIILDTTHAHDDNEGNRVVNLFWGFARKKLRRVVD